MQPISDGTSIDRRKAIAAFGIASLSAMSVPTDLIAKPVADNNSAIQFFDTVSSLKKRKTLRAGDVVATLGYYAPGDGGNGIYRIVKPDESTLPDQGSIIGLQDKKYAILSNTSHVNYKMFGAKEDGKYDDGVAIKAAHDYANRVNIPVINLSGSYWIKETNDIEIRTNVNWGHSIFNIDEQFNSQKKSRFHIKSNLDSFSIELNVKEKKNLIQQIKPGIQIIPELIPYKNSLVFISDDKDRIGYRAGSSYDGQSHAREEFFYVEEGGKVIGDIAWGFNNYTNLSVYPCDSNYLIVDGGTFYLSGNNPGKTYNGYWKNGFSVTRSRTIIRNQWVGLEKGNKDISLTPRTGFYAISRTYDVSLENVRLIPWIQNRVGEDQDVGAGTYGILCGRTLQTRFYNVTAEGGKGHWGVFGTNLNKRFFVDYCNLNRVDVHFHCWNLHIRDSHIGYKGITITGGGNLIIENTTVCSRRYFVSFRRDFGSTWDGDICINNCKHAIATNGKGGILGFSTADFNYHYPIQLGRHISIHNFVVDYNDVTDSTEPYWLMRVPSFSQMKHGERLRFPEKIICKDIRVVGRKQGVRLLAIDNPQSYQLTKPGKDDGDFLQNNGTFLFDNIQLEQINNPDSIKDVHLLINSNPNKDYQDEYALYPKVIVSDCNGFTAFLAGAANMFLDHCNLNYLTAGLEKHLVGTIEFDSCLLQPVVNNISTEFYNLAASSGINFTNCLFLPPVIDGESKPELVNSSGIIKINKLVRFNHLNSRISHSILQYFKLQKKPLNIGFIQMLKAHSDLESESVE